ncbi:hypothetical protein [Streptomyces sp. NPDC054797]
MTASMPSVVTSAVTSVVTAVGTALVTASTRLGPASCVVAGVPGGSLGTVMSATRIASTGAASGHREDGGGGPVLAGIGGRVGAAISHGRRGGQRRPQQDRDRQQAPGTGSLHPGSMGPRAPGRATLGHGSPERVDR